MVAWGIYIAGSFLLGLFVWRITRPLSRYGKHFLQVSYWVLVLTPFSLGLEAPAYAPAVFIIALDAMFQGFESILDALILLVSVWLLALILSLSYLLLTRNKVGKGMVQEIETIGVPVEG